MDGAGVDTAVHWRAAAKTYGRRADAILPYLLLDATETSGRGAPPVTVDGLLPAGQTDHATDHAIGEPDVSCLDGQESQQCPWCEEAIPSTPSTESAVSTIEETAPQVPRGGNTADELEPGGRRGAATSSREGELTIPNSTKTSGDSNARRRQRRYTCASCGGELPDTDLWCVQGSRDSQCSVRWDEVLSEGRRWREDFCGGGAGAVTKVKADGDGTVVSDAFQSFCLGGREERASMRHRHRREERGVASGGPPAGARTQTEDVTGGGGGKGAARSGSTVTSTKRRLETELELGGRHARERREFAARQLRFHASGEGVCNARESDDACVVVRLGPSPTEKSPHKKTSDDGGCEIKSGGESKQASTARRRDRAVRVIQQGLRYRRQERVEPREGGLPSGRGLHAHAGGRQASERAVTKVQSAFRGFHVRRALQVIEWQ